MRVSIVSRLNLEVLMVLSDDYYEKIPAKSNREDQVSRLGKERKVIVVSF